MLQPQEIAASDGQELAPTAAKRQPRVGSVAVARRAMKLKRTRLGLALFVLIVLVAILGPWLAPHSSTEFVGVPFTPPAAHYLLGTDNLGRDVLTRTLYGGRTVLWMALSSASLGVALGVLVGMLAGYSRGLVDAILMRVTDVLQAFPHVILVLLFVSMIGTKLWLLVVLVAFAWVPQVARVTRAITLETSAKDFVQAVEVLGMPRRRILAREILPNLSTTLLIELSLRLTWSVGLLAAISFLGFGVQAPTADWGLMINENRTGLVLQPWATIAPIAMIGLFTLATNLIAEGLSRALAGITGRSSE